MLTGEREKDRREILRLLEHERRFAADAFRRGAEALYQKALECAARYAAMADALA